jgi:hypothetical protein
MADERTPGPAQSRTESAMLAAELGGEPIADDVRGLGATLVITATRAIVVHQGAHFRPRNGVRSWPFDLLRNAQLAAPRGGNGRVVLRTGPYPWQAISLFIAEDEWAAAGRVVAQIRARIAQAHRSQPPDGPSGSALAADPPDDDR